MSDHLFLGDTYPNLAETPHHIPDTKKMDTELSSNPLQLPTPIYQWQHSRGGLLNNSWWHDCKENEFNARDNKPQFNVRIVFETTAQIELARRDQLVRPETVQNLIQARNKRETWVGEDDNNLRFALDRFIDEYSSGNPIGQAPKTELNSSELPNSSTGNAVTALLSSEPLCIVCGSNIRIGNHNCGQPDWGDDPVGKCTARCFDFPNCKCTGLEP